VRWIYFSSVFLLFGTAFFWFAVEHGSSSASPDKVRLTPPATIVLLQISAPIAALSGLLWLAGILANMTGDFKNVFDPGVLHVFFFETAFGPVSELRLMLQAALLVIAVLPFKNRLWMFTLLGASALLLITQAWLGHAAEGGAGLIGALMIATYSIHVLAAAAWVGGLPFLLLALGDQRQAQGSQDSQSASDLLARYSMMGMIAVTLIVVTGVINAAFRTLGSFGKLFDTSYGWVLFTKVSLVSVMLTLAYINRFILMPRLRANPQRPFASVLRASVSIEIMLSLFVVAVTAVLGITPPPQ
jgi:putative copper resistance protein D